jgi:hypothetical protein
MIISADEIAAFNDFGYILIQFHDNTCYKSIIRKILKLSTAHGVTKVLIDSSKMMNIPPITTQYYCAKSLMESKLRQLQFAILTPTIIDGQSFFENVCVNRGGQIRFFVSEENAKKWLGIQE